MSTYTHLQSKLSSSSAIKLVYRQSDRSSVAIDVRNHTLSVLSSDRDWLNQVTSSICSHGQALYQWFLILLPKLKSSENVPNAVVLKLLVPSGSISKIGCYHQSIFIPIAVSTSVVNTAFKLSVAINLSRLATLAVGKSYLSIVTSISARLVC